MIADVDALTDPLGEPVLAALTLAYADRAAPAWAELEAVTLAGFATVSEREAGPWICCAPCSAAMVGAFAGKCPPTLAAAHGIRTTAGYPHVGGTSPSRIAAGSGFGFERLEADRALIDERLEDGWAMTAAVAGDRLAPALKRYVPGFAGGHDVALAGRSTDGRWGYWDPAAPAGALGVYADPADVMAALWNAPGSLHALKGPTTMALALITDETPRTVTVAKGAMLYELDGSTRLSALAIALGPRPSPFGVGKLRAIYASHVGEPGVYLALVAATIVDEPAPATSAEAIAAASLAGAMTEWNRWAVGLGIPSRPDER